MTNESNLFIELLLQALSLLLPSRLLEVKKNFFPRGATPVRLRSIAARLRELSTLSVLVLESDRFTPLHRFNDFTMTASTLNA
jgi:hypothetical protein